MTTPTGRRMKEGNAVKRLLVGAIGTLGCVSALVGCSSGGHAASPAPHPAASPAPNPAPSTAPSVAAGGGTAASVKVGGADLAGLNPASVTCVRTGGKIDIGSGSTGGAQQALAVVVTGEAPPKVESLAL